MIEVTVVETGDCAEAETVEGAILAARTIGEEARAARGIWGFDPTIRFDVDGATVRLVSLRAMLRMEAS